MSRNNHIVAIIGPAAAGKSDMAVGLSQAIGNAEIINVDSMQVYCGMDVGTAKLPVSERGGVTHHLLGLLDITESATVTEFQVWACEAILMSIARSRIGPAVRASKRLAMTSTGANPCRTRRAP